MKKMNRLAAYAVLSAVAALPAGAFLRVAAYAEQQPGEPGRQRVTSIVQEIDHTKGTVGLASAIGALQVRFPTESLAGLKAGDIITVEYSLSKPGDVAKRAFDAPRGLGEHRIEGTIERIDYATGAISVKSADSTLQLTFPPPEVRSWKQDEPVTVVLAFVKA